MPRPTGTDLHVDSLLTQISVGYKNTEYIADSVFPIVPVNKRSDLIAAYEQSHWFRDEAKKRAPGTKSSGGEWTTDLTARYFCERYSFRKEIVDDDRDNADAIFGTNFDRDATEYVTDKIMLARERRFVTDFFVTTPWTTTKTGTTDFTQWSDYGASNPLVDMTSFQDAVELLIAREPKTLVIGKLVLSQLRWHPALVDTYKFTQPGILTEQLIAGMLGLERLLIGKSIVTTDLAGTAEASVTYSRVWGKHGLLLYVPSRPSLMTPAAGYTFVWQRVPSALQYVKRMRDEEREVDIIEANSYFDQKAIVANAGLFISGAIA